MNEVAEQIINLHENNLAYLEKAKWVAYYNKYNQEQLCISDAWNYPVSNLVSKELTDDRAVNAEKLRPFYEWLGERVELCLNIGRGLTNEELKYELGESDVCI